jgi:RimJ/RimL family protein N-acetyltransferase
MNPAWCVQTGRLDLRPVWGGDLADLQALKADPRVFAVMLGGVRNARQTAEELAADVAFWGRRGFGMWTARACEGGAFLGIAGLLERTDGRGIALRFAFRPEARGHGLASEAASAALRYGHERAHLPRIIAVAREDNFASRTLLGGIGMVPADTFPRDGVTMVVYESLGAGGGRFTDDASLRALRSNPKNEVR